MQKLRLSAVTILILISGYATAQEKYFSKADVSQILLRNVSDKYNDSIPLVCGCMTVILQSGLDNRIIQSEVTISENLKPFLNQNENFDFSSLKFEPNKRYFFFQPVILANQRARRVNSTGSKGLYEEINKVGAFFRDEILKDHSWVILEPLLFKKIGVR